MNKQEMAEFMAKKVLDKNAYEFRYDINNVIKFIYSPEGFFAVWDKILEKYGKHLCSRIGSGDKNFEWMWIIGTDESGDIQLGTSGYGPTKEEAFYNAVYEVMKDE